MHSEIDIASALMFLVLIAFFGLIGGFISAVWDSLTQCLERLPDPDDGKAVTRHSQIRLAQRSIWFFIGRSLIGLAGAFGIVLIGIWIGKVTFVCSTENVIHLIALCLTAGLFSRKLLPLIGQRIEDEIFRQRINKTEKDAKSALESSKEAISFTEAMNFAQTALSRTSTIDVRQAIEKLQAIEPRFMEHRTLHIYLGRLHRRLGDYDAGIIVLRKYVDTVDQNTETRSSMESKQNIADAYYNIACYHSLKAKRLKENNGRPEEIARLEAETIESLKLAIKGNPENRQGAMTDPDLDFVRDKISELVRENIGCC